MRGCENSVEVSDHEGHCITGLLHVFQVCFTMVSERVLAILKKNNFCNSYIINFMIFIRNIFGFFLHNSIIFDIFELTFF